jgi:class 3 adenylate cyclase
VEQLMETPRVQYVRTEDGVNIAYATVGIGRTVVSVPAVPLSHVINVQEIASWTQDAWAKHFRHTHYDGRGSGMSDRAATDFSLDGMLKDLSAVIGRVADGPVVLSAAFDGVPIAIAYTGTYPEAVSALVVADGWTHYSDQDQKPARAAERALRGQDWNLYTETISRVLLGETFDPSLVQGLAAYIRSCVEPDALNAIYSAYDKYDVTGYLPLIKAPTLVLYNPHNQFLAQDSSQRIAAGIAGAEFRLYEDRTYSSMPGLIAEWLGDAPTHAEPAAETATQRSGLRTVLFTDLVAHTEMMSRLGDEAGRAVLREHERITREVLKANGGTEVKTMGDGFMASFGSVTQAVECAIALQKAFAHHTDIAPEPLSIRVGLNAGEPIEEDGDLFGATVILASRIAAKADGGEILVADTVRGLCSGKGFLFSDRGEFIAKGFEDPVRIYEVSWSNA